MKYNQKYIHYSMYGLILCNTNVYYNKKKLNQIHLYNSNLEVLNWLNVFFNNNSFKTIVDNKSLLIKLKNNSIVTNNRVIINHNKRLTPTIVNKINILGLLFWYLCCGNLYIKTSLKRTVRYITFNLFMANCYNKYLIEMFNRFNIDVKIHKFNNKQQIYLNATNCNKLINLFKQSFNINELPNQNKFDLMYNNENKTN